MSSLKLLGSPIIEADDGPLDGPATQRHRIALLALLAIAIPDGLSRDKLVGLLWPERSAERARNLLKQAIHTLRKALGPDVILASGDVVRLNTRSIVCDVVAFEAALAAGDLERAVELHRGPFLDGFFLSDSTSFEHWLDRERDRLADMRAHALDALAEAADSARQHARAVDWWKLRSAHDPFDTRVATRLVQALIASGNRAAALQHALAHERLLRDELGLGPVPELVALAERHSADTSVPPAPLHPVDVIEALASAPASSKPAAESEPASPQVHARTDPEPIHRRSAGLWRTAAGLASGAAILAVIMLLIDGLTPHATPRADMAAGGAGHARSIAILPFEHPEGTERDSAFARGMHSDLITALSGVQSLAVLSRSAVLRYHDGRTPLDRIGRELAVDALLDGDVQRIGDRVRINARLSDARTGRVLWAHAYERELTVRNLFALQSEITRQIATSLEASLSPAELARIATAPTENLTAYQYFQRSQEVFNGTRAGNLEAARLLRLALEADSTFLPALTTLANTYGWRVPNLGFTTAAWDTAHTLIRRALHIDSSHAQAHAVLAAIYGHQGYLEREERAARRALELDAGNTHAMRRLAESLRGRGRFAEALRYHEASVQLLPSALAYRTWVGVTHANLEHFAAAERWYRGVLTVDRLYLSALEGMAILFVRRDTRDSAAHYAGRIAALHASEPRALTTAAAVHHYLRDYGAAERLAGQVTRGWPGAPVRAGAAAGYGSLATTILGYARLQLGNRVAAEQLFAESRAFVEPLIAAGADSPRLPYELALIEAARGDHGTALAWLGTAVELGFRWAWMLEREPAFDALRDDPRFRAVIARVRAELTAESAAIRTSED